MDPTPSPPNLPPEETNPPPPANPAPTSPSLEGDAGVAVYVGATGAGKTTLACLHASRLGRPVVALDLEGGLPNGLAPKVDDLGEAIEHVFALGGSVVWTGDDEGAMALVRACMDPGEVTLLIDGLHALSSARTGTRDLIAKLIRRHRHSRVWVLATSQHYSGDVSQAVLACTPHLHVFRTTQPATLERFWKEEGLPPGRVQSLPRGRYYHVFHGFS